MAGVGACVLTLITWVLLIQIYRMAYIIWQEPLPLYLTPFLTKQVIVMLIVGIGGSIIRDQYNKAYEEYVYPKHMATAAEKGDVYYIADERRAFDKGTEFLSNLFLSPYITLTLFGLIDAAVLWKIYYVVNTLANMEW